VTICAWCPELHVLKIDRRRDDYFCFALNDQGQLTKAWRQRPDGTGPLEMLTISHSICPACSARVKSA
jgi:hypothetical protein